MPEMLVAQEGVRCSFFAIVPQQAGLERTDCWAANGSLSQLFSGGTCAVRFQ